jgi:hypothetical protein
VFVFPACNEPGLEIVQALSKSNKIQLFGGSTGKGPYDPARNLLERYVDCPRYDAPDFKTAFSAILRDHKIDIVIPAWDPLVETFSDWSVEGVGFITPRPEIARLLRSTHPPDTAPLPVFAKPDRESGSRSILLAETPEELAYAVSHGLLLCDYLPGPEYTVDCISDRQGDLLFYQARARSVIGRGIALSTESVQHPAIDSHMARIAETLRIEGPWFAQFKEDAHGVPVLMEINARIGGSMTLTRLSGVNIPLIAVFMYAGYPVRIPAPRTGVLLNRSLRNLVQAQPFDAVVWDWDDTLVRKDGKPDPDAIAALYDLHNRGIRQFLLSKNPDVKPFLESYAIPDFFEEIISSEDKGKVLQALFIRHGVTPAQCIVVNDSFSELFALEQRFPDLRIVTPDALDYLGREKLA